MLSFNIESCCPKSSARAGTISTSHGKFQTPVFMPVGTYGAIKTQTPEEIKNIGYNIILSNTYHLFLRPGTEVLRKMGGLHKFMNWNQSILTDSGGFQVYSLRGLRKIEDDGVTFQSHLDGKMHKLTPQSVVDIQREIGSDIMMMLDICPPGGENKKKWEQAVAMTTSWAKTAMEYHKSTKEIYGHKQTLMPIVQGGTDKNLREKSANELMELDASAYAIGGLAVGEQKEDMQETVSYLNNILPSDKPRYLMGVGTPEDLVSCVDMGVDMFDCVMPTRNARNGQLFTYKGKINIRNSKFQNDERPIDKNSLSEMSQKYSKSYLHHLFKTKEILGLRIATQHNLHFYYQIMNEMRKNIINNKFDEWKNNFFKAYNSD